MDYEYCNLAAMIAEHGVASPTSEYTADFWADIRVRRGGAESRVQMRVEMGTGLDQGVLEIIA
jgi:hypothetical protein